MFVVSQIVLATLRNTDFVIQECVASVFQPQVSTACEFVLPKLFENKFKLQQPLLP